MASYTAECFLLSSSAGRRPRWEQISLFMGDVTPREEVSEEDKHKDKSSGPRLIFSTDTQTAGEGFLWAADGDLLFFSSLFPSFWSLLAATEMIVGLWREAFRGEGGGSSPDNSFTRMTDYNHCKVHLQFYFPLYIIKGSRNIFKSFQAQRKRHKWETWWRKFRNQFCKSHKS